jgi:predicted lipid-binding transport protein (Tim44 family)
MFARRWTRYGLVLFAIFFLLSVLEFNAYARAGFGGSMGSRGSRSYSFPRSTPGPASPYQGARQYNAPTAPASSPFWGGGFLRNMAGGLVGGMLGGMLFRSLGFAGGGGMGGGIGIMDIVLIGAILYGIYWFIKRRRMAATAEGPAGNYYRESWSGNAGQTSVPMQAYEPASQESDVQTGISHIRQMDPHFDEKRFTDGCLDLFFQIQGAWANRDMTGIKNILTNEMFGSFQEQAVQLKDQKRINRMENIAVRSVEITEIWQEKGQDFITAKIYANLLDYTIDEANGQVISGSKTVPVKFNEYWTFTRPVGDHPWQLSAINQAE